MTIHVTWEWLTFGTFFLDPAEQLEPEHSPSPHTVHATLGVRAAWSMASWVSW